MNKDDEDLIQAVKSKKKDSFFNFPLDVIKFDAFTQELEEDQFTGIVEITTKQKILRIFLKRGKTLKCLMDDREVSMFEIEKMKEKGTVSLYRIDEKVLSIMVLFSGAEPQEILSTEYADIKKYLKVKERDHFSGIIEFLEEGARGFLRLDKGEPQDGIFISEEGLYFFSEALSKIMEESSKFQIKSYNVKTLHSHDDVAQEILARTHFNVYHKVNPRGLLTAFENFTPGNAEEIGKVQLHPHQEELFIVENAEEVIGLEFVYETKEYQFAHWVLKDLFLELAGKDVNNYKYVWYWIPECTTVEFLKEFDGKFAFDVVFKTKNGDLLMQNPLGELLFVARFLQDVSKQNLQEFVEEIEEFKDTRIEKGDLGAVFLVASTFDTEALDLAEDVTQKSIADKLAKLKGFLRISKEAGVHLILVQKDPFKIVFP